MRRARAEESTNVNEIALRRTVRRGAGVLAALALAASMAACGDDDDAGGSEARAGEGGADVADARQAVEQARKPLASFEPPGEPPASVPKDKSVFIFTNVPAPFVNRVVDSAEEAAKALGWRTRTATGRATPQSAADLLQTAISSGADAIVFTGVEAHLVKDQLARATDAGIPVAFLPSCGDEPPPEGVSEVRIGYREEGALLADWIVQQEPGGAEVLALDSPEFFCLQDVNDGFNAQLEKAGSSYEVVEEADSPATDIQGPQGPQRLAAILRKQPTAKYFFVLSESWAGVLEQAKKIAGRDDVVGLGADSDFYLPRIRQGARFVSVAPDTRALGFYAIDAVIRGFNDEPPVEYDIPARLVDAANASQTKGPGVAVDYDLVDEWLRYWGAGS
jgi:ABC-type sugar transport system substrate-binding protein